MSRPSPAKMPPRRMSSSIMERAAAQVGRGDDSSEDDEGGIANGRTSPGRVIKVDAEMADAMNNYFSSLQESSGAATPQKSPGVSGSFANRRLVRRTSDCGLSVGEGNGEALMMHAKEEFKEEFSSRVAYYKEGGDGASDSDDDNVEAAPARPAAPAPPEDESDEFSEDEGANAPGARFRGFGSLEHSKPVGGDADEEAKMLMRRVNEAETRNIQYKTTLQTAEHQLREMIAIDEARQERIEELEEAVSAGDHILSQVEIVKRQLSEQEEQRLGEQRRHAEQLDGLQRKLGEVTESYMVLERERGDAIKILNNAEAMREALESEREAMNRHKELMEQQVRLAQQAHELESAQLQEQLRAARQQGGGGGGGESAIAAEDLEGIRRLKEQMENKAAMFEEERDSWKQSTALFQQQLQMQHEELNHILKQVKTSSEAEARRITEAEARAELAEAEVSRLRKRDTGADANSMAEVHALEERMHRVERENRDVLERSQAESARLRQVNEQLREELRATQATSDRFRREMERQLQDIELKMHTGQGAGGSGGGGRGGEGDAMYALYNQQVIELQQQLRVQAQVIAEAYQREVLSLRERLHDKEQGRHSDDGGDGEGDGDSSAQDGTPGRAGTEEVERRLLNERPASGAESAKSGDLTEEMEAAGGRERPPPSGRKGASSSTPGDKGAGGKKARTAGAQAGGPAAVNAVELDAVQQEMEALKKWKQSAEQMFGALHEQLGESMQLNIELEQQARQLGEDRASLRDALHDRMDRIEEGRVEEDEARRAEGARRGVHWDEEYRMMQGELHHRDLQMSEMRQKHEQLQQKYIRQSQRQHQLQQLMLQIQDGAAEGGGGDEGALRPVSGDGEYWPESAFGERPLSAPSSQHQRARRRQQGAADPDAVGMAMRASRERPLSAPSSQHSPTRVGPPARSPTRNSPRRSPGSRGNEGVLLPEHLVPSSALMARHARRPLPNPDNGIFEDEGGEEEEEDDDDYDPPAARRRPQTARPVGRRAVYEDARPQTARAGKGRRKKSAAGGLDVSVSYGEPTFARLSSCRHRRSCAAHDLLGPARGKVHHTHSLTKKWKV